MLRPLLISLAAGLALVPAAALAEVRSVTVDGQTFTYAIATEPQRGATLTEEDILALVKKAKPIVLTVGPELDAPKPDRPAAPK